MKKNKSLFVLLALCFSAIWADAQVSLSFEESLRLLRQENQSLKIADKSIEIAKAERDKLNAFWYPSGCICTYVGEDRGETAVVSILQIRQRILYIP